MGAEPPTVMAVIFNPALCSVRYTHIHRRASNDMYSTSQKYIKTPSHSMYFLHFIIFLTVDEH